MIDIQKLKALAGDLFAKRDDWYTEEMLISRAVDDGAESLVAMLSPSAVLELIAELEGFRTAYEERWERARGLMAEVDQLKTEKIDLHATLQAAKGEIERLQAENEALRKDAERYRWLRDHSEGGHQFYLSTPIWFTGVKFSKENVDATIDAAMKSQKAESHERGN